MVKPDRPPIPRHKMVINIEVVREILREGGKNKVERYLTQVKVFADKTENGEWAYYYLGDDSTIKLPCKWLPDDGIFVPAKAGALTTAGEPS